MSPEDYISAAKEKGLSGICLTEHDKFWPEDEYLELCKKNRGLVIINGNEKRCWDGEKIQGDFLVFGCRIDFEKPTIHQLTEAVHRLGGIVIAAHPFREMLGISEELIYQADLDAIEVYSSNIEQWQTQLACSIAKKKDLPVVGASDAHTKELVGFAVTKFDIPVKNEKDFVKAIKNHKCSAIPHKV